MDSVLYKLLHFLQAPRTSRPSTSSSVAIFYDARDADSIILHHDPPMEEEIYQEIPEVHRKSSKSSSSSRSSMALYDDAKPVKPVVQMRPKKKAAPPPPPSILKKPTSEIYDDATSSNFPRKSSTSSSASSNSSVSLRMEAEPVNHRQEIKDARKSYHDAPEQYRKESSYLSLDGTSDPKLKEDIANIISNMGEEPIDEEESSSSSSNEEEVELPKKFRFQRRKSSFSSLSDTAITENENNLQEKTIKLFDGPDNCVFSFHDNPGIKIDDNDQINLGHTSDSDSDSCSSESHGSLHIHQPIEEMQLQKLKDMKPTVEHKEPVIQNIQIPRYEAGIGQEFVEPKQESSSDEEDSESSSDEEKGTLKIQEPVLEVKEPVVVQKIQIPKSEANFSALPIQDKQETSSSEEDDSISDKEEKNEAPIVEEKIKVQDRKSSGYGSGILQEPIIKFEGNSSSDGSSDSEPNFGIKKPPLPPRPLGLKVDKNNGHPLPFNPNIPQVHANITSSSDEQQVKVARAYSSSSSESSSDEENLHVQHAQLNRIASDANDIVDGGYEVQMCTPAVIRSDDSTAEESNMEDDTRPRLIKVPALNSLDLDSELQMDPQKKMSITSTSSESSIEVHEEAPDHPAPKLVGKFPSQIGPKPFQSPQRKAFSLNLGRTRSSSVSSSSSSSSDSEKKKYKPPKYPARKSESLSDEFLKKLNKNYQPVYYSLRKVNSTTQTDQVKPLSNEI